MINWDRVDELRGEVGEESFAEIVTIFLDEVEDVLVRIAYSSDPESLKGDLHFLKGGALNLGFRALGALCEDLGPGGRLSTAAHLAELQEVYDQSKAEFLGRIES
jgi:hypothetical protein